MKDLSLHILDIVENSIAAGAENIEISLIEDLEKDEMRISIKDDGIGMPESMMEKITDPFITTKKIRKVGLGLPLFKKAVEESKGTIKIISKLGCGTQILAKMQSSHIDRKPLGSINETILMLVSGNPDIHISFLHKKNHSEFYFDTKKITEEILNFGFTEKYSYMKKYLESNHNF